MAPAQQRFWPDPQPLVERLGRGFFRALPEAPGVYHMRGAADAVLYVGKARSLRRRLGNYRVANPERMPRRILRLLRQVEQITWEECADEPAALRREAELLLTLKPRFNRAGVWPRPGRFVAWRVERGRLTVAVTESSAEGWDQLGPFGALATHLHRALVRLLWCRLHPERGLAGMPAGWFEGGHRGQVEFSPLDPALAHEASTWLNALAGGDADACQRWLLPSVSAFEQAVRQEDVEFVAGQVGKIRMAGTRTT